MKGKDKSGLYVILSFLRTELSVGKTAQVPNPLYEVSWLRTKFLGLGQKAQLGEQLSETGREIFFHWQPRLFQEAPECLRGQSSLPS